MPAVVLYLFPTMATGLNRMTKSVEDPRSSFRIVQEGIVRWVQLFSARIGSLHRQRDPVPEVQSFAKKRCKLNGQFRCSIQKKRPSGFKDATALTYPLLTPGKVVGVRDFVIVPVLVILPNIERWICENSVDNIRTEFSQNLQAIGCEEHASRSGQKWCSHCMSSVVQFAREIRACGVLTLPTTDS